MRWPLGFATAGLLEARQRRWRNLENLLSHRCLLETHLHGMGNFKFSAKVGRVNYGTLQVWGTQVGQGHKYTHTLCSPKHPPHHPPPNPAHVAKPVWSLRSGESKGDRCRRMLTDVNRKAGTLAGKWMVGHLHTLMFNSSATLHLGVRRYIIWQMVIYVKQLI